MEKLEKARKLIQELEEGDYIKLKRSIGVGLYLFNLLKEELEPIYLNLLKEFDRLPIQKRIGILKIIKNKLSSPISRQVVDFSRYEKHPIEKFFIPLEKLKVLDDKEKKLLKALGIKDLYSALWYLPVRYEDRRLTTTIKTTKPGQRVALKLRVVETGYDPSEKYPAFVKCEDETGTLYLRFRYKDKRALYAFRKGSSIVVYGKLKEFHGEKYMVHPEVSFDEKEFGRILPFYYIRTKGEIKAFSSKTKHKKVRQAIGKLLEYTKYMPEYLPEELLKKYAFPKIGESLYMAHNPLYEDEESLNSYTTPFQKRLIYEELFLFQMVLQMKRRQIKSLSAIVLSEPEKHIQEFIATLPFELTPAQKTVINEILQDLKDGRPMNRLLQGDVGSGKTVVAMAISYAFAKEGYQCAIIVPTEILAQQHYESFRRFLEPLGVKVGILTSSVKGSLRRSIYKHVSTGNLRILVGTHALLEEKLEFKNLAFVVIDEQHRFGVLQRREMLSKGKDTLPHCLVMSATPIPRTLALSLYGDLDISVIDEMPTGRKPVITKLLFESEMEKCLNTIRDELNKGGKVYVVYPLIESSEKMELKSAVESHRYWQELFPDRKVLLLHGRLKDKEKEEVMKRFKEEGDILVSTTVVEVGVDVPSATVMVIESAHMFGLSQIHQLRGRVGRSDRQSYCFLIVPDHLKNTDADAIKRLKILVNTNDGFKIAEEDLKLRGPGELLGASQSGYFGFNVANLARAEDRQLLQLAKEDATEFVNKLSDLENLRKLLIYKYQDSMDLSYIA
ncbi:ATP-dependent DNA helicase RecG [Hydrogenobacter hydrogenophilus]|uniref:ATP-dependent DNA helicase RecG n=1 Tax=Hydrogenobacter hydrogenophilus TaxID=35835 RepID=A0A285NXZ8_9AQUI|nr:ATP-dependent DNA helicase RecG [Hydrogenobacter hydrogenophilus]SNZ14355.1 ATP-dependent DNA helicase RecG [Hydrogenobacter hydrogenophilus]